MSTTCASSSASATVVVAKTTIELIAEISTRRRNNPRTVVPFRRTAGKATFTRHQAAALRRAYPPTGAIKRKSLERADRDRLAVERARGARRRATNALVISPCTQALPASGDTARPSGESVRKTD